MDRTRGFTLIEVVIVLMIGAVLTSITFRAFGDVQERFAVKQARNAFVALQARTRAQAIEFGTETRFLASPDGDSVWITRNDTTLEKIRFGDELGVDLQGMGATYRLCMNPRGYGDEDCNSFDLPIYLRFVSRNGSNAASLWMLPLGQLVY